MDTSMFNQERYDALRGFTIPDLGKVSPEEVSKYLFEEIDGLRKSRLMPYVTAGPETGISFYGGRRTMSYGELSLGRLRVRHISSVVLRSPWYDEKEEPGYEYWGALMLGYDPVLNKAEWLWTKFWYPTPGRRAATTERLTELELTKLMCGDSIFMLDDTQLAPWKVLGDYTSALHHAVERLQEATAKLNGRLHLNYAVSERFSRMH